MKTRVVSFLAVLGLLVILLPQPAYAAPKANYFEDSYKDSPLFNLSLQTSINNFEKQSNSIKEQEPNPTKPAMNGLETIACGPTFIDCLPTISGCPGITEVPICPAPTIGACSTMLPFCAPDTMICFPTLDVSCLEPPQAVDDAYATDEDTPLIVAAPGVLGNDSDPNGDPLTAVPNTGPNNGLLTLNANGSFSYTPNANFNGVDSFTYMANDGINNSNVATVTITVNPVNDPPVAADDAYATDEDTPLIVAAPGMLGNDTDADGDPLTLVVLTVPQHGSGSIGADGNLYYTPEANYNGTDSFTYKANDGHDDSNVATVTITVNPINDPPVADDDAYVTDEDTPLIVAAPGVLVNDSDIDGDPLTAALDTGPGNGTLTLNADGSFTYTPNLNFNGFDSFTYVANDGQANSNVATVIITVNAVNDPPVADANGPYNGFTGSPVSFDGSGSSDVDSTIDSYEWDFGDGSTGTGITTTHIYASAGTYTVTLTVTDDGGATDTVTTTVEIIPIQVTIDIKPGGYPNSINLGAKGVVPVAVLSTISFDASLVNPVTVRFANASPLRWAVEDVDGDGNLDLILHFKIPELDLVETSTEATLTGQTIDGFDITGNDSVRIVPIKGKK